MLILVLTLMISACSGGKADRIASHMNKARDYMGSGNYEKARVEFSNVLQMDQKNTSALLGQAQVQEKLENWREAAAAYKRVTEIDANNIDAKEHLARLYFLGRAPDEAMKLIDDILQVKPASEIALTVKGAISANQKHFDVAMKYVDQALDAAPDYLDAIMLKASLLNQQGKTPDALAVLKGGLVKHPDNAGIIIVMAQIHAAQDEKMEATALLEKLVEENPGNVTYIDTLVSYLAMNDQEERAENVLRKAIEKAPVSTDVKLALIRYLVKTNQTDKAFSEIKAYIDADMENSQLRLALAGLYAANSENDNAVSEYTKLIDELGTKPDALKARVQLASLMARLGKHDKAKELLAEGLKENPNDNDGLLLRGKLAMVDKDYPQAISSLRAVLRDQPESFEALNLLGKAHLANNETQLAAEQFDKAVLVSPDPQRYRYELGQFYLQTGQAASALQQLEIAARDESAGSPVFESLLKAQLITKDYAGARATVKRVRKLQPETGLADFLDGMVDLARNDSKAAIGHFSSALARSPDAVEPLSALVKTRLGLKQVDQAAADIEKVLASRPDNIAALNIRGELYLIQNNPKAALDLFKKAVKLQPTMVTTQRNLAIAQVKLKQYNEAIATLETAIDVNKQAEPLVTDLAGLYQQRGEYDKAIDVYAAALEKNPESMLLTNNLAMLLVSVKTDNSNLEQAGKLAERLGASENPAYLDTYGWIHYLRGDLKNALPALERAVSSDPERAEFQYHLGMIQYKNGDITAAESSLKAALANGNEFNGSDEARKLLLTINPDA